MVGGRSWGGRGNDLRALRRHGGRISVRSWGHRIGRGHLDFQIVGRRSAHLVAVMTPGKYVLGVGEMPSSWHRMALRAQAIAARTYLYWRIRKGGRNGCACDILATPADQLFIGWDKESSPRGGRWRRAVRATRRKVIVHRGKTIYAAYGSSTGGHSEAIENVWQGSSRLPYLRAACDPTDDVPENPNTFWRVRLSARRVTAGLRAYTGDIGRVRRFTDVRRGPSGRVKSVKVVGGSGADRVQGWDVRVALGLRDSRFSVNRNLNIFGRIRAKYDRLWCRPGRATSPNNVIRGGRFQRFRRGRIYQNDRPRKLVWLHGRVNRKYVALGAHRSRLRLPLRYRRSHGGTKGVFERGAIICRDRCRVRYT